MNWTPDELRRQLSRAEHASWWPALVRSARAHEVPLDWMTAIASRETNLQAINGDGGHGRGLLQVDDRWHALIDGTPIHQATQAQLIDAGCGIAADSLRYVAHAHPDWPPEDQLKVAASAYNCGLRAALAGSAEGDSDLHTTGRDYGRDVMARRVLLAAWLK